MMADRSFDRQMVALTGVIFLTEAAIAVIFFALVQQYPAHLLNQHGAYDGRQDLLLREAAAVAGTALSVYGFVKLSGQPLCGLLADHFGARRMLLWGLVLAQCMVVLMAAAAGVTPFVVACGLFGLGVAVVWPAIYAVVGDAYAPEVRGRVLAAISAAQLAGTGAGIVAGSFVVDYGSFSLAFGLVLLLNLTALLLGLGGTLLGWRAGAPAGRTAQRIEGPRGLAALLSPPLLLLFFILALISMSLTLLVPALKPYSSEVLHRSFSSFSLLLAVPAAIAVLTLAAAGRIADAIGRANPMLIAVTLWPLCLLTLTFSTSLPLLVLLASGAAFAYALGLPAWSATLVDLSSAGSRGLQVGAASAAQGIGGAIGPLLGGQAVRHLGISAPFRLSAALLFLAALLTLIYRARTRDLYRR